MRLFNRLSGDSRTSDVNRENKVIRGRKNDEGNRRANAGRKNLTARKLGMEALEERQLLSVNPITPSEYDDIRNAYSDLELPSTLTQVNVIELTDLSAEALQNAVNQAAQTTADDIILVRTTPDNYVVNLENTAIIVNLDSENYGKLTILGAGDSALTIETTDVNAFTVLNGDFTIDGAVVYNYVTLDYVNDMVLTTPDAKATLGSSFVVVNQVKGADESGVETTSYLVDRALSPEESAQYGDSDVSNVTATSAYRQLDAITGDYNVVRNRIHATLRSRYDYFGYTPSEYRAVSASQIYDAESVGYAGWVGTVANMMAYTGWAQQAGFSTRMTLSDGSTVTYESVEDAVAAYLMNGFVHASSSFPYSASQFAYSQNVTAAKILDYLFAGNDEDCFGSNYSHLTNNIEAGGFFMDIDFGNVGGYVAASDSMLNDLLRALRDGNAVTLEVVTTDNQGSAPQREYVSVWGYVYNPNTLNTSNLTANGVPTTTVGLICSNPTRSSYLQPVTDNHYNNQDNNVRGMTHYVEQNSTTGDSYDTYSTYLLSGSGSNLQLVHAPYTYLNDQGAVQGAANFPEGFNFYGSNNGQYVTYTSRIVGFSWLQQYNAALPKTEINQADVLSLESMPGNTDDVIYLYFGGIEGSGWDGLTHPELNLDNAAGYGVSELKFIEEVWRRVAEDYAPFKVNVTTSASVWASATRGIRCIVGGYNPSAGGLSGVGSYGAGKNDNYVYPFSLGLSAKSTADAAAHEIGHSFGLSHDGFEHNEYLDMVYSGNVTWGPIMGAPYSAVMTQWSQGEYVGATNLQDDIAIIASTVGFRDDAFGDTIYDAEKLEDYYVDVDINEYNPLSGTYYVEGIIEKRTDYDVFSFTSYGGQYVFDVSGDGADHRFINRNFDWTTRRHSDTENAQFAGLYYASTYNYTNLNLKVELLDETGEIVLIGMDGKIVTLNPGESIVVRDSDYYFYVVDQFGKKVYVDGELKEGYQTVDDSIYTTFSHFVTPELDAGKTYYVRVSGVGEGNPSTTGYSDYGSLGQYTLQMHELYENFYIDEEALDVTDTSYTTRVDNTLSWQEAIAYSGRRLEDGQTFLGNTARFNASTSGTTINLQDTLRFTYSRSLVGQPYSAKRFVLDAMDAWDSTNDKPGITINANQKFRAVYVDNTTVELYGFTITGGVAETTNVVYLYFGGIDGTGWSGELHPAFDLDGDPTYFNAAEQDFINEVYLRVAEDYAPYNVTVTTDQAVFEAATNAIRVVIGGTGNGRGGVAYVGSFGTQKQDCYVFPNSVARSAKNTAEAVSHEVGHTMGLNHDGRNGDEYYGGNSVWGPIMGAPYGSTLTQWSKGEYAGATNSQDDLAIIAGRLGYKDDDYENNISGAQPLSSSYLRAGNSIADGILERTGDVDFFSFVASDSTYVVDVVGTGADFSNVNANGYAASRRFTNLDLVAKLYDADGNLLYTCDPSDSLFAHFQADGLTIGDTYYISVEGTGNGDANGVGYSNYGSVGQYYVTVAATDLSGFVGEERYETNAQRNKIVTAAAKATKEKGETYGQVGQTNNGGGIYNHFGWLTIGNSIIAGNTAYKAGGGIYNQGGEYTDNAQHDGWLYIFNTSIIGNTVTEENAIGGGLYNEDGGVATLVNVTIAGNIAGYSGGGLENSGNAYLYNTIIAKNDAKYGADVYTEADKSTRAYSSLIGDESRNASLLAQNGGVNTANADGYSLIGTSQGTSVNSTVVTVDPQFVGFREYDLADWSPELWRFWNFRLKGDSPAVDLGRTYTTTTQDYANDSVYASYYRRFGISRYEATIPADLAGQTRIEGSVVDAGAFEVLGKTEFTGYVPTSAGADVVNTWESSIVVSRAIDDQTGSVAPFLVNEPLYLNLSFINEGKSVNTNFETTVYLWKYDPYTAQNVMMANSTEETGTPIMKISVDFGGAGALPGGPATVTCENLATGEVQILEYDGVESYLLLDNVALGSIEDLVQGLIAKGEFAEQNEEGYFVFGYKIDSANDVEELREDNNFFTTTSYFDVVESPVSINDSIVVTTNLDVVDPYDGLISLREAVEVYAGSFYYSEVALQEGDVFEANGVTYFVKDGLFYVDTTAKYQVYPGEQFSFDQEVEENAIWDAENGKFVDSEGADKSVPIGTTITRGGVDYIYNGTDWLDADANPYALTDGESIDWTRTATVTVTYMVDVYIDPDGKQTEIADGTEGVFNGVDVTLVDGVWTNVSTVASYTRDDVQGLGVFSLADGTEVAVVNGVFRRVATNDVAIVQDGAVVTLGNGQTAVYRYAQDRFIVTETTEYPISDGDVVTVGGVDLTFRTDDYVDVGGYEFTLEEGTEVTLSNGYSVVYQGDSFVYKSQASVNTKIAAGTEILLNGETYTYKSGLALMRRVSREANAVVFSSDDPNLDGATFELVQGPLTLNKTFTLDCVDPYGNLLDLTITSSSDDPCLFRITDAADATVRNFKFLDAVSTEAGSIFENYGELTLENLTFANNKMERGNLIFNDAGAKLVVLSSTFENNVADSGALIYNLGDAYVQGVVDEETGEIKKTTFTNDVAALSPIYSSVGTLGVQYVSFDGASGRNGGAINVGGGTGVVANVDFNNTSADEFGGAIFFNGGVLNIDDSNFANTSAKNGGAIAALAGAVTINNTTFDAASASENGGVIYNETDLTFSKVAFNGGSAVNGGQIYNTGIGNIVAYDSTFTNGVATGDGGAIYSGDLARLRFAAIEGEEGSVAATFEGNTAARGGAIYAEKALDVDGKLVLSKNSAEYYGAVRAETVVVNGDVEATQNEATVGEGGAFRVRSLKVTGAFTANENTAKLDGGAIYADADVTLNNVVMNANKSTDGKGGAIFANGKITIAYGNLVGNTAKLDGGAVYAGGALDASNTLFAKNSADGLGGAIYALASTALVNVTIADNTAADGAGLYTAGAATIDNSILAQNVATGTGYDLFIANGGSATLRNSLLGDAAHIGEGQYTLDANYRSILGADPQFDENYGLKATSLAVNTGSNALDRNAATDLAGNARRVGLTVAGVVRTVDMGAYEFQTVVAPDLAILEDSVDYWTTQIIVDDVTYVMDYYLAGDEVCVNFNVKNIGDAVVVDNFFFNVSLVGRDENGNIVYEGSQAATPYKDSFDLFNWLNQKDWIEVGGVQRLTSNFGVLPAGYYEVSVTLDVEGVGNVYEWGEEDGFSGDNNNVYKSTFSVKELPSTVVTTAADVVDPTDNETSLREAVAVAADYQFVTTFLVEDGTSYVTENGQELVVSDGYLTELVDVVYKDGVPQDLEDGDEFLLNGVKVYYRYELNGGHFEYANGKVADVSAGLAYPDGSQAELALATQQYIHYVDGSDLNDQEGSRYTYNVLQVGDTAYVLEDGNEFTINNVTFTYRRNADYPSGAFFFDNGDVVNYEDAGSTLSFASLAIGNLSTRNVRVEKPIKLQDGSTVEIVDGVARVTKSLESAVTFADKLQGATITLDPAQGDVKVEGFANLGKLASGEDLIVDRAITIDGADRNVTVSGDKATRAFAINENATATINALTFKDGFASYGGAILNNGDLTLNNVDFANNVALWRHNVIQSDDLQDGLGGAIANYGTLVVDGGSFANNGVAPNSGDFGTNATEFGGAIFSKGTTIVKNATFDSNSAYAGGAIVAYDGTLRVENSTFTSNVAERAGAIYTLAPTEIVASGFYSNTAEATSYTTRNVVGGAIYAKNSITFYSDPESDSNVAVTFDGNKAEVGGAIYSESGFVVNGDLIATNNAAVNNPNYATDVENDYGAIYANGNLNVTGDLVLTGNTADGAYGAAYVGGSLTVGGKADLLNNVAKGGDYGVLTASAVTIKGDANISGNSANGAYGAIGTVGDFSVGGNATISSNTATDAYSALSANLVKIGGALVANDNVAGVESAAIDSNSRIEVGGGASVSRNVNGALVAKNSVSIGIDDAVENRDSLFADNVSGSGAGVLAGGAVAFGGNVVATGNRATATEGGFLRAGGSVGIAGSLTATNNEAATDGGAIYTRRALSIGEGDTNVSGNKAGGFGGAIYAVNAIDVAGTSVFASNQSGYGDVATSAEEKSSTSTGDNGETIIETTTTTTYASLGGAVYVQNGGATFGAETKFNNNAGGIGGGLYAKGAVEVKGDASFVGNSANGYKVVETTVEIIPADGSESTKTTTTTREGLGDYGAAYINGDLDVGGVLTANDNAATGRYGALYVGGAITSKGLVAIGNSAEGSYGAIYAKKDVEIDGDLTLENNSSANGGYGALYANAGLNVTGDALVSGNTAGATVGAIRALGAVNVDGNLTANNNEAKDGVAGALYISDDLTVGGNLVAQNNKAAGSYGAIYAVKAVEVGGDLTLQNNSATGADGAMYAKGGLNVGGDALIFGNTAGAEEGAVRSGGAITINGNATIENNTAESSYGAIRAADAVAVGGDLTLRNNSSANGYYGALYTPQALTVGGSATISENTAGKSYGALRADSVMIAGDATIADNKAGGSYGAIYTNAFKAGAEDANVVVTVSGNEAGGDVGAIYATNSFDVFGSATFADNKAGLTPKVETIEEEVVDEETGETTAKITTITTVYGKNGALAVAKGSATITGDATFTGNSGAANGAASVAGDLTVGGALIVANNAANGVKTTAVGDETTEDFAGAHRGGLYIGANLTVDGDASFTGNKANHTDGAAHVGGTATFGGDLTISDNEAIHGERGGLHTVGDVTVEGILTATNNKVAGSVGALYTDGNLVVNGYVAPQYDEEGAEIATDVVAATITGNVAGDAYGAVRAAGTVTINGDAKVADNSARTVGAIYAAKGLTITGDAEITGNKADEAYGAIRSGNGMEIGGNATISNNTAGIDIGAIGAGTLKIGGDATITENAADGSYGAISSTGAVEIGGKATISKNTAGQDVGAIAAKSVSITGDATITENAATGSYGAVNSTGAVEIGGAATISKNAAGQDVGAIAATSVTIGGEATITDNKATGAFGAINTNAFKAGSEDANVVVTVSGNEAGGDYGAIYAANSFDVFGSATFADNKAGVVASVETIEEEVVDEETGETVTKTTTITTISGKSGALHVENGGANITGDASFTGNSAATNGAAYVNGDFAVGGALNVANNTANGVKTTTVGDETTEDFTKANNGGIYVGASLTVDGDAAFVGNKANNQVGAAYISGPAIFGGALTVSDNEAINGAVGGLDVDGDVAVEGVLVATNNKATGHAGAISVEGNLSVNGYVAPQYDEEGNEIATDVIAATITGNVSKTDGYGALRVIGALTINGDAKIADNSARAIGAILAREGVTIAGDAEITGNKADERIGAISANGNVIVVGAATITGNEAGGDAGAIYATGSVELVGATITGNKAGGNAGAISAKTVTVKNSLIANNEAGENGGAIYARDLNLVNATVAKNTALNGGALYVEGTAKIDNSIVAANAANARTEDVAVVVDGEETTEQTTVGGQGVDIYATANAKVALRNSLLQNAESVGEQTFGESWLVAENRSFVGVDPQFVDADGGDFSLKATSPAINTGSNALANDEFAYDLAGAVRIVGLTVDGVVYSIDMGAYEYQTVIAPDLAFGENAINFWYGKLDGVAVNYYYVGKDVVLDFAFSNIGDAAVVDKFNVEFKVEGTDASGKSYSVTKVGRYQTGATYFDWLNEDGWIYTNGDVSYARQNLGELPVGTYKVTVTLDVDNEIVEKGEEDGSEATPNNVYVAEFEVHEDPSVVVNTTEDGEYNPLDDKITLREAVEVYAGPSWYESTIITDSGEYVTDDLIVVAVEDGVATVDVNVVNINGGEYFPVHDGDSLEYGAKYVSYDAASATFVYPDGTRAPYARTNYSYSLTITLADGTELVAKPTPKIEYLESIGEPYSDKDLGVYVDVLVMADGSEVLLTDLTETSILYDKTHIAYHDFVATTADGTAAFIANGDEIATTGKSGTFKNGAIIAEDGSYVFLKSGDVVTIGDQNLTYVGAAIVPVDFEGSVVPFVPGEMTCENGTVLGADVKKDPVLGEITTYDGLKVTFNENATTSIATYVGNTITFADELVRGAARTIKLDGSQIVVGKNMTIDGATPSGLVRINVDADKLSRVFAINQGVEATINMLNLRNGQDVNGGAIANYGTLALNSVSVASSQAISDADADSDKILYEGLGGAIYNSGALTINGGRFATNKSSFFGGAIYSIGSLDVVGATFASNSSSLNGGAIYALNSSVSIADSLLSKNTAARNGGAIGVSLATGSGALTIVNSAIVDNKATAVNGGGVYAYAAQGANLDVLLTNVTVAGNSAANGVGGGLYGDSAKFVVNNSIVAKNSAKEAGDLALEFDATATVKNSILGDGESVVNAEALTVSESFVGTTSAPVDPKFGAAYALTTDSLAVNNGANDLAVYADGSVIEKDLSGAERVVGVDVDGVVYSVDMGAYEFQTVAAPDLAFDSSKPVVEGYYATIDGVKATEFLQGWDVAFDYVFGNYGSSSVLNAFNYKLVVVALDENGAAIEGSEKTFSKTYGEEEGGYLTDEYRLNPGQTVGGYWNLGQFAAGRYGLTLTLDSDAAVIELDETNNVFTTNFSVAERPSIVVTTEQDVVDDHDGLTSLREAIANVGTGATALSVARKLQSGDTFALAQNDELGVPAGAVATYADGALTFQRDGETVALATDVAYDLANGDTFKWLGGDQAEIGTSFGKSITFAENVYGKTITLADGEFVIDRDMEINADGANIMIDAHGESRAFVVAHGDNVVIRGLKLANGAGEIGASIYNAAQLFLTNVSFENANAVSGAGVYNAGSALLDATNVAFVGMNATDGGAIYNAGELIANGATFDGNTANVGAAIYNAGSAAITGATFQNGVAQERGGAIYSEGDLTVSGSEFSKNSAQYGGAIVNYQGALTISGADFSENSASGDAGAIDNYGVATISDAIFTNNTATGFGGAIYNSLSSSSNAYEITLGDGVAFNGNRADGKGGAIYNSVASKVTSVSGVVFTGNTSGDGGAIYNAGSITADSSWRLTGNAADGDGGAIYNAPKSTFTAANASFVGNSATNAGAVYNAGTFNATTVNFESNAAAQNAGAIWNVEKATATVSNSVVWKNAAGVDGGAVLNAGTFVLRNATIAANAAENNGGGLYNTGTVRAYNTIVAGNAATAGADLYETRAANFFNSILGSNAGVRVNPSMTASKVGDPSFAVAPEFDGTSLQNAARIDLRVASDSIAVNAGNDAYALDAQGAALVYDFSNTNARVCSYLDSVDIGAYEFPFEDPSTVVTTDKDVYDLTDGVVSLREAIDYAERLGTGEVTIDPSITSVTVDSTLEINSSVKIASENGVEIHSSGFNGSVVAVGTENDKIDVEFENVSITGGTYVNGAIDDDPNYVGGGLRNYANLTLTNVTINDNSATYGGGVYNAGTLRVVGSTLSNNSASYYGGIYNRGALVVENSWIAGNSATYFGGGLGTYAGATIVNTAIVGNFAATGAGVYAQINAADLFGKNADKLDWTVNLVNTTVVGNVATETGGGVWANHVLNVNNSIIYGNNAKSTADLYVTSILSTSATTLKYSNVGRSNVAITGTGVKSVDPTFISFSQPIDEATAKTWDEWDLNLQIGSPMINAGSDALAKDSTGATLKTDILGNERKIGLHVDMGAFEEQGNSAPTGINFTLADNLDTTARPGAVVATMEAVDSNADETFTYELVGDESGLFAVDGDKIVLAKKPEAGDYSVTVKVTDSGDASTEATIEFSITDASSTQYGTPVITTIGLSTDGDVVVAWSTDDPAKEYVVEYRVKGAKQWNSTSALTGDFGRLEGATFNVGDVVEARIKAVASSTKNESDWSDVVEYAIEAPAPSYNTNITERAVGTMKQVGVEVVSNTEPHAYWSIDWNDGTAPQSFTGLSLRQQFDHIYAKSGVYTPILYVDNQEGVELSAIVVDVPATSGARVETTNSLFVEVENVFSAADPVSTFAATKAADEIVVDAVQTTNAYAWNEIAESLKVDANVASETTIAVETGARVATAEEVFDARCDVFAALNDADDFEVEAASDLELDIEEALFDESFLNDLFQE